jgi:RNA polymerase sigma-70 factor (ECF subfamily)
MTAGAALADADLNLISATERVESATAASAAYGASAGHLLVPAFMADEPGAFEAVVEAHQEKVARLAHRLLGWRRGADVQDVVQDVFLAALRHRRRFRGESGLGTWLSAITVNCCRTHQRRQQLRRLLLLRRQNDSQAEPPASEAAASEDAARRVRQAVQALPPRDREVVVLRYFEGLDAEGIAAVTGISKNAVEVRLHRARARLAETLGAWHREEQS